MAKKLLVEVYEKVSKVLCEYIMQKCIPGSGPRAPTTFGRLNVSPYL